MIYTCTLNPAIDLFIETQQLKPGVVNRTNNYDIQANGKGVNVSFILKMLGIDNTALGVGGGFTNSFIEDTLTKRGIPNKFIHTDQPTRINVFTRVIEEDTEYKEVNSGPHVTKQQVAELMRMIEKLTSKDILIISGSFSEGINPNILVEIAKLSKVKRFKLIIDTNYKEVLDTLAFGPELLKPNVEELEKWFGSKILSQQDLIKYCEKLIDCGAKNILLSMGSEGALFVNKDTVLRGDAPKGVVVNTACSGDTMLGTFVAGMCQQKSLAENLKFSIAAGSSTAFKAGLTDFSDVEELNEQIKIETVRRDSK
ncbi:1-phosphofructokinase [Pediococcus pentosaceus]|uniref:1-phosphofructokinase n=1 Tax=Pediococcus pentosaceus TaxID=1255 RepID=UPI001008ABEA|nr:1-phosphofructokinase [Pediococcus pentosaceus]RXI21117.1 1-phosphofructokinase [Pediococcus pentosaceus]